MSQPNNSRPALAADIDACHFHPDLESVGWVDLPSADGSLLSTIGVCASCKALFPADHRKVSELHFSPPSGGRTERGSG